LPPKHIEKGERPPSLLSLFALYKVHHGDMEKHRVARREDLNRRGRREHGEKEGRKNLTAKGAKKYAYSFALLLCDLCG
jgi:hypothetical protein